MIAASLSRRRTLGHCANVFAASASRVCALIGAVICGTCLSACDAAGSAAARHWLANEANAQMASVNSVRFIASNETVADERPGYSSQVVDPFAPERIALNSPPENSASKTSDQTRGKAALFVDAPLAELHVVGYLSGAQKQPVALVRHDTTYRSIHLGERLGKDAVRVKEISDKGVRVALDDAQERWLPLLKAKP